MVHTIIILLTLLPLYIIRHAYIRRKKIREGKIPGRMDLWVGSRTVTFF